MNEGSEQAVPTWVQGGKKKKKKTPFWNEFWVPRHL